MRDFNHFTSIAISKTIRQNLNAFTDTTCFIKILKDTHNIIRVETILFWLTKSDTIFAVLNFVIE